MRKLRDPLFFPKEWATQGNWCAGVCLARLSPFVMSWYSDQLAAAEEPSLYAASRDAPANEQQFRFTTLPTFDRPVIVRIVMRDDGYRLIAKELSGAGGYAPGMIERSLDRMLTRKERNQVEQVLAADLFTPDPDECSGPNGTIMVTIDGTHWLFETAERGRYEFSERDGPSKGSTRAAGLLMLKLTGWKFKSRL